MRCLLTRVALAACITFLLSSDFVHAKDEDLDLWDLIAAGQADDPTPSSADAPQQTEEIRTQTFLSRPQQTSIRLDILQSPDDPSILGTDYIFTAIYATGFITHLQPPRPRAKRIEWHPHIFDLQGNLIWHAPDDWIEERAWSLQSVDLGRGVKDHLAMNDAKISPKLGYSFGTIRFFNSAYVEIDRVAATAGLRGPDGHELNLIDKGRRLLHDSYQPVPRDLTGFNGPVDGWVLSGCFQERDMATKDAIFTWCSVDYIPLDETREFLHNGPPLGDAEPMGSYYRAWDYFHINSVDKDEYGDYYISGKNTDTIYKIAGPHNPTHASGEVIWKLGGKDNSFEMIDDFKFFGQHHLRLERVTRSTTVVSIFDNADWYEGFLPSNGIVVEVNNDTMTARVLEQYMAPNNDTNEVEGTMQRLPNGNVLMAWGPNNVISEHKPGFPGELLWYAKFGSGLNLESYHCFKLPWKGQPVSPPDIFAYAESCDAPVWVYMSWNGATEHRSWNISAADTATGPGRSVATAPRDGYETAAQVPAGAGKVPAYVYAEALDEVGSLLGTSEHVKVWVPSDAVILEHSCDAQRCAPTLKMYEEKDSQADLCRLL